ncbi:hypothetical protein TNCV_4428861 [Trichonephila clavipes]|nr:hypothetical protein TNCV_4428861 [Trichonephila clavipes]
MRCGYTLGWTVPMRIETLSRTYVLSFGNCCASVVEGSVKVNGCRPAYLFVTSPFAECARSKERRISCAADSTKTRRSERIPENTRRFSPLRKIRYSLLCSVAD